MANFFTSTTPLPPTDCIQSLEKLAAKIHFYSSVGRSTAHIKIDMIEFDIKNPKTAFRLYARCSAHRQEFPSFVSFKLDGELQPTGENTEVQFWLQLHKPFSMFLKILIFLGIVIVFALIGSLTRASASIEDHFIVIVVVFLAVVGYIWTLYRSYQLGMVSIPSMVQQVLRQEAIPPDKNQKTSDWIKDLSGPG